MLRAGQDEEEFIELARSVPAFTRVLIYKLRAEMEGGQKPAVEWIEAPQSAYKRFAEVERPKMRATSPSPECFSDFTRSLCLPS